MRPEKLWREMDEAFEQWMLHQKSDKFHSLKRELTRVWKKLAKKENDYRTGEETYGYLYDHEINSTLHYISDRWNCAFRLKWLLDGLEQNKF